MSFPLKVKILRIFLRKRLSVIKFMTFYINIRKLWDSNYKKTEIIINETNIKIVQNSQFIRIYSPYRILNYSNGIDKRLEILAQSYGYGKFFDLKPNSLIIDIGANIGEFSLFSLNRGCRVIAFEPDLKVFNVLKLNLEESKYSKNSWAIENKVLSNKTGKINFYLNSDSADSSLIIPEGKYREIYSSTIVETIRIDEYIINNNIKNIDLIKCDAEGAEPEVFEGCLKAFPFIKAITVDCSPERNGKNTFEAIEILLRENNFSIISSPRTEYRNIVYAINNKYENRI